MKTGILIIDQEHHDIFETIIRLYQALEHNKGKTFYDPLITQLIELMMIHFHTEEAHFARFHYNKANAHIREHIGIRMEIDQYYDSYIQGILNISMELLVNITMKLMKHIESGVST